MPVIRFVFNDSLGIVIAEGTEQNIQNKIFDKNIGNILDEECKKMLKKEGFQLLNNGRNNGDVREEIWVKD